MLRASASARTSPSMLRAAPSAASARAPSPLSSAAARSSSVRPSAPKTGLAARTTCRTGSGGNTSACTAKATPPPTSASIGRVGNRPSLAGALEPMMMAETLASTISIGPPPTSTAADMANTIITPTCGAPPLAPQHGAPAAQPRRRHGQPHHHADLRRPAAEHAHQQVGDQHPEHHAAGQFQRPLALLADRGPETDHGGDRSKARFPPAK